MSGSTFEAADPDTAAAGLTEDGADVWLLNLDLPEAMRDELVPLLTNTERRTAAAFAFPHLRKRHVSAHGQMRRILAAYARQPAQALSIRKSPEGKPFLAPDDSPGFNLSHSGGLGLLAIARSAPIGADIERIRPSSDLGELAVSTFSTAEHTALAQLPENRRTEAFFACWTRKEAVVKFDGRGLGMDLASFTVSVDPDATLDLVTLDPMTSVRLFDVPAPLGYRGAIAARPDVRKLRYFRLPAQYPA
jgi:4'-phosphopantetheinyl transferase